MNREKIMSGIWSAVGGGIATMIIGFAWGGWVLGSTSMSAVEAMAEEAVIERLAPICVAKFNLDAQKENKLKELNNLASWDQEDYIKKEGWATMPFENEPDDQVAARCSTLLTETS